MLALRRQAVQSAERLSAGAVRTTRRYASGHAGDHGHAAPKAESLGTQFYIFIAAVPISIGVYKLSQPSQDGETSSLSKFINSYSYYKERWAARNTLHTAMIEQAAFDKHLFQSSAGTKHVNLRFPEIFNTGSPYNVVAGQGPRNIDQLVSHYEKLNADDEEKKASALKKTES